MHRVERSVLLPYSAEQMFNLVANVRAYPDFLPWCAGTSVRPQSDGSIEASVDLNYRGVRSRFTTRNRHEPCTAIHMDLVDGPFRSLKGTWSFKPLSEDACKVQLKLQFQFASGLLGRAIAPVFESIAGSMIDSFTKRAEEVYA